MGARITIIRNKIIEYISVCSVSDSGSVVVSKFFKGSVSLVDTS